MPSTISCRLALLASISSDTSVRFGWVCRAHSRAIWLAARPISLTKCQCFTAEVASRQMLPMSSEYVLAAVSKPKEASICSFFMSPSIVFGTPTTHVGEPSALRYSASTAALVFESSPPMTISPSSANSARFRWHAANSAGFSILSRPLMIMSKPPVLRNGSRNSAVSSVYLPSITPPGPLRKPYNRLSAFAAFNASNRPAMTLWPPGACPPERTTPTFSGAVDRPPLPWTILAWG